MIWFYDGAIVNCEACRHEVALAVVASAVAPYSYAVGRNCLRQRAEPAWIVLGEMLEVEYRGDTLGTLEMVFGAVRNIKYFAPWFLDGVKVFFHGRYLTAREYITHRKLHGA